MSCMALNDNKGGDYTVKRTNTPYSSILNARERL